MKTIIVIAMCLLSGCSVIDKKSLFSGLKQEQDEKTANALICEGNFFEVGFDCAELSGHYKWFHPVFAMYLGCTVNWYQQDMITKSVVITSNDLTTNHEIEHIRGRKDNFKTGIESQDPEVIKKYTELARNIEAKYIREGKCMEINEYLLK